MSYYGNNKVMPFPLVRQQGNLDAVSEDDEIDPDHLALFDVIDID